MYSPGKIFYQQYLKSDHWKKIKEKYWNSKLPKVCKICGSQKNLAIHHRTYKHLYKENISVHLILLCSNCHNRVHFPKKKQKTPLVWKKLVRIEHRLFKKYRRVRRRGVKS